MLPSIALVSTDNSANFRFYNPFTGYLISQAKEGVYFRLMHRQVLVGSDVAEDFSGR